MRPGYAALPSGMPKVERRIQGVPEGSTAYPGQGVVTRSARVRASLPWIRRATFALPWIRRATFAPLDTMRYPGMCMGVQVWVMVRKVAG